MIPKFRAWLKKEQKMDNEIDHISWLEDELYCIGDGITYMVLAEDLVLMQSTGLKDKNGKEIFEGDILEVTDKHNWLEVVSYSQEKAMFVTEEINREFKVPESPLYDLLDSTFLKFKVIGNIYENPELLEVKSEIF